ncbi:hypothetical protein Cgig2_014977 [Carnegiea gigantea]|uniref:Reverse transcriptase domain-containing protein n=1 Tax=Carnegiea gigantea TaxID=171969 RepID=A0A9Q1Q813_9CARY|nr:hypothetical protein Cgig2_014977 [Carnegiea gigantea]
MKVQNGRCHPFPTSHNGPSVSILLFTDDVVFFAEASMESAHFVKNYLDIFCRALGQKVSGAKSNVYFSTNTNTQLVENVRNDLEMRRTEDLGWYLGVPSCAGGLALQAMRALSSSYLMKRVGRELLYPQTSTLAARASNGWRGILEQLYFVKETVGMAVGDDCAMRFCSTLR